MKKMLRIVLCLLTVLMTAGAACADGVTLAALPLEMETFAHYPSCTWDAQTGEWSLQAYQADALVDRFWNYGMKNSSRIVVFHLAAEGNANTGVWTPVLRFWHMDGQAVNARAVSVLVDGERFDLAASSVQAKNGRYTAECITVPLTEASMPLVEKLQAAESVTVRLIGEELYTTQISRTATANRAALEAESLVQLESGVQLLRELGAESYGLWDLSADAWERAYGYRPAVNCASVELLPDQKDEMGMILPDESGEAAVAAQETLAQYGFLNGTPGRTFDENAVNAVLRAQIYLDRVPTGCFDAALAAALEQGRAAEAKLQPEMKKLGDIAGIALERFWFADAVSASADPESLRSAANADNVLLVADGLITNLSAQELHLFMQLESSLVYNGQVRYEADMVCESSGGTELDVRLLPLAQARLIVYAEIPAHLAQDQQAQWSIEFAELDRKLVIDLQ